MSPDPRSTHEPNKRSRHSEGHRVGSVHKIAVAANNSCLFSCFNLLLHENSLSVGDVRAIAASVIHSDPDTFNDITLEKPRQEYLQWLLQPQNWGGYIELIALSRAYEIQIIAIDIDSGRLDEYGDSSLKRCIYLIYDGLHYDAVVGQDECCRNEILTTFNPSDQVTLNKIQQLVSDLRRQRQQAKASEPQLICRQCQEPLSDMTSVKRHAASTGHTEYGEI